MLSWTASFLCSKNVCFVASTEIRSHQLFGRSKIKLRSSSGSSRSSSSSSSGSGSSRSNSNSNSNNNNNNDNDNNNNNNNNNHNHNHEQLICEAWKWHAGNVDMDLQIRCIASERNMVWTRRLKSSAARWPTIIKPDCKYIVSSSQWLRRWISCLASSSNLGCGPGLRINMPLLSDFLFKEPPTSRWRGVKGLTFHLSWTSPTRRLLKKLVYGLLKHADPKLESRHSIRCILKVVACPLICQLFGISSNVWDLNHLQTIVAQHSPVRKWDFPASLFRHWLPPSWHGKKGNGCLQHQ